MKGSISSLFMRTVPNAVLFLVVAVLFFPHLEARELGETCNNESKCDEEKYLICNKNGFCACAVGSKYHNNRRRCEVDYGRDCSWNPHCNKDSRLECIDEECTCPQYWKWNNIASICTGYLGATCYSYLTGDTCGTSSNLECIGQCVCKKEHFGEVFGEGCTKTTNGSKCAISRNCDVDHFLDCHEGRCLCEVPGEMIWAPKDNECVALVGKTCDIDRDEQNRQLDCVAGAKCEGSGPAGICECTDDGEINEWGGCTNNAHKNYVGVAFLLIGFVLLIGN